MSTGFLRTICIFDQPFENHATEMRWRELTSHSSLGRNTTIVAYEEDSIMTLNKKIFPILVGPLFAVFCLLVSAETATAQLEEVFALRLGTQSSSPTMCKKIRPDENIRIRIANHRDVVLQAVPNQFIPQPFEAARKKSYVHFLTLQDLTNGSLIQGAIAFNTKHAVIFSEAYPQGISREQFINQLPSTLVTVGNQTFNTFLRLHPILNAAIDGCRPYPSQVTYGTDDEIEKIEAGRLTYRKLATRYNAHPQPQAELIRHERGSWGEFYDPRTQEIRASYQAVNPLNFYQQ
jgi:hypothetical protein